MSNQGPLSESSLPSIEAATFEYPLQENIRSFLRLESIFKQIKRNTLIENADNHLHALKLLFELLEILERGDTRSEIIKELTRLLGYFKELEENPEVDSSKLKQFLSQVEKLHQWVHAYQGKFGDTIRKDPFIESVKYRSAIPGGSCQFDCPDLYLFMMETNQHRQQLIRQWLNEIKGVETSIEVILRLIRDNGQWREQQAPMGSFMIETTEVHYKLIRIKSILGDSIFPEFSSGKHRSSVHFMQFNDRHKKMPVNAEIIFELACC